MSQENDTTSWCEDLSPSNQTIRKICYCRTDACNNGIIDVGEGLGDGGQGDDDKGDEGDGSSGGGNEEAQKGKLT